MELLYSQVKIIKTNSHTNVFKKLNSDGFISSRASLILTPETIMKLLHYIPQSGRPRKKREWANAHTRTKNKSICNRRRLAD